MLRLISKSLISFALLFLLCITFWKDIISFFVPVDLKDFQAVVEPGATGLKFKFKDKKETFYEITVKKSRDISSSEFEFENLAICAILKDGKKIEAAADYARYDQSTQIIRLKGNITLDHHNGHLETNSATVHIKQGFVEGNEDVEVDKDDMTITAKGFRINDAESEIIFKGNPIFKMKRAS